MTNMKQTCYGSRDNQTFVFSPKRRLQKVYIVDVVGELTHD